MTTTRQTPVGVALEDGHPFRIAFALDPDISFWEIRLKPPGLDGGEAIPLTTQWNDAVHTFGFRSLVKVGDLNLVVAYDMRVVDQILAILNENGEITFHVPDGSKLNLYGALRVFDPQEMSEGARPEANVTITPSNRNSSTLAEFLPNYITAAGTD